MEPYYREDGITIYHGDCREILPNVAGDLILTDPPYGIDHKMSPWDKTIPHPREWLYPSLGSYRTILVTPGTGNLWAYPEPRWTLSWFRPGSVQRASSGGCFSHWEPVLLYGENGFPYDAKKIKAGHDAGEGAAHPCPKPLELWNWLTHHGTPEGGTVVDPFLGSGTTLVSARQMKRVAIGIEVEEKYCEIAARRLSQGVLGL